MTMSAFPAKCRKCEKFIAFLDGIDGPKVRCRGVNGEEYIRRVKAADDGAATAGCEFEEIK